ncbi:(deoxy)nucleoside triphosphate pyrophosphohydrolase [Demequina muriae]|uniref:8-oxo-dGTP diphosphatase n=1 Tax=Demequina muriae TaxID=3051664 RepID=A0ABT8GIJ2_9MICO|nr:(deoxy)nucleoside triphosphate pyrophosphohydrolase [Demequina sp. EGI L300058]MDN4481244.1 (deoxy)nucleoside triphosphate pyrophosphohydrolase [Demequina sp. EGI L300058]
MAQGAKYIQVVGAVIVRGGEILCAQRGPDGALAGMWEFPGGKVERGEQARDALTREIDEELFCDVAVGNMLTTTVFEYDFGTIELTTFWCELVSGTPVLTEHAEVRWCRPEGLQDLEWAPADIPAVELIVESAALA